MLFVTYICDNISKIPQINDNFDNIYEISTNKTIDIDNDEFVKHFKESQK